MRYFFKLTKIVLSTIALTSAPMVLAGGGGEESATEENKTNEAAKSLRDQMSNRDTERTSHYVGKNWIKFPVVTGRLLFGKSNVEEKARSGFVSVVIFLGSWCVPCQQVAPQLRALDKKFSPLSTRFFYVFTQDEASDAQGFVKEHDLPSQTILADKEVVKRFHNPQVPTVYVADKRGYLNTRFLAFDQQQLPEIERLLNLMTAI